MPLLFEFFTSITRPINFLKQKQFLFIALSSFLSMAIFWQNNTLALYTFWKMIEVFLNFLLIKILRNILWGLVPCLHKKRFRSIKRLKKG
uniref:Candidate secreted effector n=1 Tax=Meloidogyne incognita TaxID=6306 RepID=A0A914LC93_MELIC